jgi:hypothetical protein
MALDTGAEVLEGSLLPVMEDLAVGTPLLNDGSVVASVTELLDSEGKSELKMEEISFPELDLEPELDSCWLEDAWVALCAPEAVSRPCDDWPKKRCSIMPSFQPRLRGTPLMIECCEMRSLRSRSQMAQFVVGDERRDCVTSLKLDSAAESAEDIAGSIEVRNPVD